MQFALYCIDKPDSATLRATLRVPHLEFAQTRQQVFRFGGPLLDNTGQPRGSLMILELPDRMALDAHLDGDPFFGAGLFESVVIWSTRQVMPEAQTGALAHEISQARQLAAAPRRSATPLLKVTGDNAP